MAKPAAAPVTLLIKDLRLGIDVLPRQIFGSVARYLDCISLIYAELRTIPRSGVYGNLSILMLNIVDQKK